MIAYLRQRGFTQAEIARMLNVSQGFVSLVKSSDRSLTLDHLEMIASALSVPLGALLLAASEPPTRVSDDAKKLLELSRRVIQNADVARHAILRSASTSHR